MANLHLVTGYAGVEHVTSDDQGSFNAAIMSDGEYVLNRGREFEAAVQSNNIVRIFDGDALMQGRHIRMKENTYVDLNFDNGQQSKKRIDVIAIQYKRDVSTDIEESNLVIIKGTPSEDSPEVPEITHGDIINEHAIVNEMPLYSVEFDGIYIGTPVKMFTSIPSIVNIANETKKEIERYVEEQKKEFGTITGGTGISVSATNEISLRAEFSTSDIAAGSELESGKFYFVYEA